MWRYNFKLQLIITLLYFFSLFLMFFLLFLSNILLALLLKALLSSWIRHFFKRFSLPPLKQKLPSPGVQLILIRTISFWNWMGKGVTVFRGPSSEGATPTPHHFFLCFKYHPLCFTCQITSLFIFLRFFISTFSLYVLSSIFYFKFWFRQRRGGRRVPKQRQTTFQLHHLSFF